MAYIPLCKLRNLMEGDAAPFNVEGREIMLLWPDGGELQAFDGLCPHQRIPFSRGVFNGRYLTCTAHDWVFDGRSGECRQGEDCTLACYPLRVVDGIVEVELT